MRTIVGKTRLCTYESKKFVGGIGQNYVNYSVTFVNEDKHGKYKVMHIDPFNVTEKNALQLRQLFKKGTNYMTTWYAAPSDQLNPVPFEYTY